MLFKDLLFYFLIYFILFIFSSFIIIFFPDKAILALIKQSRDSKDVTKILTSIHAMDYWVSRMYHWLEVAKYVLELLVCCTCDVRQSVQYSRGDL